MKHKKVSKFGIGVIALLLAITFIPQTAVYAGERWDKLSMGAKSAVGNIIGAVSPNAGNYIKTTNFGVGQRIGCTIDRGGIASRGISSIVGYASKGIGNLTGRSGYPGMGGIKIMSETITTPRRSYADSLICGITKGIGKIATAGRNLGNYLSGNNAKPVGLHYSVMTIRQEIYETKTPRNTTNISNLVPELVPNRFNKE